MSGPLIEPDVAERVLAAALAPAASSPRSSPNGARGLAMAIDESRIESVQSGAEEGAGVRVVGGGTTYFAHVDGLDPADLERAAGEAASALRGERGRAARAAARSRPTPQPIELPARGRSGRAQGGAAA